MTREEIIDKYVFKHKDYLLQPIYDLRDVLNSFADELLALPEPQGLDEAEFDMELMAELESLGYSVALADAHLSYTDCETVARHFYELGKEEANNTPVIQGLDEAAEEYSEHNTCYANDSHLQKQTTKLAFLEGVKWAFKQGVICEGKVFSSPFTSYVKTPGIEEMLNKEFPQDTDVIVQVRRK